MLPEHRIIIIKISSDSISNIDDILDIIYVCFNHDALIIYILACVITMVMHGMFSFFFCPSEEINQRCASMTKTMNEGKKQHKSYDLPF
jgi:hypothetical protein